MSFSVSILQSTTLGGCQLRKQLINEKFRVKYWWSMSKGSFKEHWSTNKDEKDNCKHSIMSTVSLFHYHDGEFDHTESQWLYMKSNVSEVTWHELLLNKQTPYWPSHHIDPARASLLGNLEEPFVSKPNSEWESLQALLKTLILEVLGPRPPHFSWQNPITKDAVEDSVS